MPADAVLSRELKSLQEELSVSQRERLSPTSAPAAPIVSGAIAVPVSPPKETVDEYELREQLHDFANEVTKFFEEVEKNISAHPTESVVGAMLVGVLIGRLLGRR